MLDYHRPRTSHDITQLPSWNKDSYLTYPPGNRPMKTQCTSVYVPKQTLDVNNFMRPVTAPNQNNNSYQPRPPPTVRYNNEQINAICEEYNGKNGYHIRFSHRDYDIRDPPNSIGNDAATSDLPAVNGGTYPKTPHPPSYDRVQETDSYTREIGIKKPFSPLFNSSGYLKKKPKVDVKSQARNDCSPTGGNNVDEVRCVSPDYVSSYDKKMPPAYSYYDNETDINNDHLCTNNNQSHIAPPYTDVTDYKPPPADKCYFPERCCVHEPRPPTTKRSKVLLPKTLQRSAGDEDDDIYDIPGRTVIFVPKPVNRYGRAGAEWRHVKACYNMNGNHMAWIDGTVKEYENELFPIIAPKSYKPKLVKGKPRNLKNIYQQHAREGFKYWHSQDEKSPGGNNKNNSNWMGLSSGDSLAGYRAPVILH